MPKRMSRFWSVGLVVILGLALWAAAVGAADTPDPDVRFIRDAPTNITPGPGWPKGWTAPATPSGPRSPTKFAGSTPADARC